MVETIDVSAGASVQTVARVGSIFILFILMLAAFRLTLGGGCCGQDGHGWLWQSWHKTGGAQVRGHGT